MNKANTNSSVAGQFVQMGSDKFYQIENVDQMKPFFVSVVSAGDHWLFISSTGSLSAGRIRPENALFPYRSVDYIHESADTTGSKTIIRVTDGDSVKGWEPFNAHHSDRYNLQRNLYKSVAGDKILFEEINHDLQLAFCYEWSTSESFGFVRRASIENLGSDPRSIELLDGIQNIQPPNAPLSIMQSSSALLDAYKWNERATDSGLATFSLYAKLSDRADPVESLLATSVFSIADHAKAILLSNEQVNAFRRGGSVEDERLCRGMRGAYLLEQTLQLAAGQKESWLIVADIDKSHAQLVELESQLADPASVRQAIAKSVAENTNELLSLMAGSDAFQTTAEEEVSVHHYANVLFNNMRGGAVFDQYWVDSQDVLKTIKHSNQQVAEKHAQFLAALPEKMLYSDLIAEAERIADPQLTRLCYEYLPLTFGRRHGDPSRPWNHFEIKLKDEQGDRLLSYQGNWRDIFQNWEALGISYPVFVKSFIAKFVNASTVDGYNPYRITKQGIDWEVLESDDPWSNIGYWGDHQIIYLLKFLEMSKRHNPEQLNQLLNEAIFSYANVPYELKSAEAIFANAKDSVDFNHHKQEAIEGLVKQIGSDGRLLLDSTQNVALVNLTEKLLVPLLAKLSNLVLDGGIWLNTQRPEWNDANNAIVGSGLSMVTTYYMRRYISFLLNLLQGQGDVAISEEVAQWIEATHQHLNTAVAAVRKGSVDSKTRYQVIECLAAAAADYRAKVYANGFSGQRKVDNRALVSMLTDALEVIDASIRSNLRSDGLYNAYNIMHIEGDEVRVEELYPMLEGQVAVLSAGLLQPVEAAELIDRLFASAMYREDQHTFMLYPDRNLTPFSGKNLIDEAAIASNSLVQSMLAANDRRVIERDQSGKYHFNARIENAGVLADVLSKVASSYPNADKADSAALFACYEKVFNHKAFTGRSGTMFGYEGLGCIYWHMVSKLLLAVQENHDHAVATAADASIVQRLAKQYYKVRYGIGFNKSPEVYGAFPTDPYSHTPKQAGAQQPGMTGQVKEEILTRFGELGIHVENGQITIAPALLRRREFLQNEQEFTYRDVENTWQKQQLSVGTLGFTYCQVPFIYHIDDVAELSIEVVKADGETQAFTTAINRELSQAIFDRNGVVKQVNVVLPSSVLMD